MENKGNKKMEKAEEEERDEEKRRDGKASGQGREQAGRRGYHAVL